MTLRIAGRRGHRCVLGALEVGDEYLGQRFDYVITVCDQARQVCPVFPGVHESLHWGYADPAEATGTDEERMAVFRRVFIALGERIQRSRRSRPERRRRHSRPDAAASPPPRRRGRSGGVDGPRRRAAAEPEGRDKAKRLGDVLARDPVHAPTR